MHAVWKLKQAFVKDIIEYMDPTQTTPYNTISSIVRILEKKRVCGFQFLWKDLPILSADLQDAIPKVFLFACHEQVF
ncbi:BlaI/MecI/CopY family transcriptional regulator [Sphingobacterium sp. E70]|uniref:BlaI/MecI/CopY family transcriptional regulator n=1 Tax=Sphingobacterium sp. E70 TaxID=2853439 RepID=UPI00359C91AE